jgi:uncharacterized protein (UPF0548 family)
VISLRALNLRQLEKFLTEARSHEPTYADIGASRNDVMPTGFHHVRREERIGVAADFERAAEGLRTWAVHEGAGFRIYPHEPVAPGATVIALTSVGPFRIAAPCRVTGIFKEPDVFGFTYGTLPGHPERGEESFVVHRRDGATFFAISAFSVPADVLARLGAPVSRAVQKSVTRKYVVGLRHYVEARPKDAS